jgi:signal transduction histidine kinase
MHGGTIAIDSTVGKGTTIRVWLPNQDALEAMARETSLRGIAA